MAKELPQEHPDTTEARQHDMWLYQDKDPLKPETLKEFLENTHEIGLTWYKRWNELWKKVNPTFFKHEEDKKRWLHEQEMKALAAWHIIRGMRMYWHAAGLWKGNPMDPEDKGEFVIPVLTKPLKKLKAKDY